MSRSLHTPAGHLGRWNVPCPFLDADPLVWWGDDSVLCTVAAERHPGGIGCRYSVRDRRGRGTRGVLPAATTATRDGRRKVRWQPDRLTPTPRPGVNRELERADRRRSRAHDRAVAAAVVRAATRPGRELDLDALDEVDDTPRRSEDLMYWWW